MDVLQGPEDANEVYHKRANQKKSRGITELKKQKQSPRGFP